MKLSTAVGIGGAALILALTGCSGVTGGDAPKSVEDKAAKLAADSVNALTPVPNHAIAGAKWLKCSEETPGVHRFKYTYTVTLDVEKSASQSVFDREQAYWAKQGYVVQPQGPDTPARGVYLPKDSDWSIVVGVASDTQMSLTVDAECVHVSSDPKTG